MYFNLSTAIVDRTDLDITEKMACVVLARYANRQAFEGLISIEVIALKMGVPIDEAERAIQSLSAKGLIQDGAFDQQKSPTNLIANHHRVTNATFDELQDGELNSESPEPFSESRVAELFEEVVPRNRLQILYGLADQNINRLRDAYQIVKQHHKYDAIEALADYLQTGQTSVIKSDLNPDTSTMASNAKQQSDNIERADAEYPLADNEAKALFDILDSQSTEAELELDEIHGKQLNQQINLGRVQNLYRNKYTK